MSHLIRQEFLHIEVEGTESDALKLQRILPGLSNGTLKPAIARALERAAPSAGHLCIEKVELDLGVLQLERLEEDLAEAVERGLQKWLQENVALTGPPSSSNSDAPRHDTFHETRSGIRLKTTDDTLLEALVHFLRTGTLPWSFRVPRDATLEELILTMWQQAGSPKPGAGGEAAPLLQALAEPTARKRLVRQFSPRFIQLLLAKLSLQDNEVVEEIRKELRLREQEEPFAANSPVDSPLGEHPEATEGLYIDNAGLILLHPFLPRFFAALGVSDEEHLLQPDRALCLLHYLATGQPAAPEYELALPKILCGLPLPAPVSTISELRDVEKEEAQALLEAVIRHWDVLRNSTPDELRGTFLLRPGKLSLKGDGDWLLQVEPQTTDILLQNLPWGFSIVKFTWMQKMLWVEWG